MALNNFRNNPPEPSYDTNLCSVPGCLNWWAVKIDKPKCSHHQWMNTGKPRKPPIASIPEKSKTVAVWYDEVKF